MASAWPKSHGLEARVAPTSLRPGSANITIWKWPKIQGHVNQMLCRLYRYVRAGPGFVLFCFFLVRFVLLAPDRPRPSKQQQQKQQHQQHQRQARAEERGRKDGQPTSGQPGTHKQHSDNSRREMANLAMVSLAAPTKGTSHESTSPYYRFHPPPISLVSFLIIIIIICHHSSCFEARGTFSLLLFLRIPFPLLARLLLQ